MSRSTSRLVLAATAAALAACGTTERDQLRGQVAELSARIGAAETASQAASEARSKAEAEVRRLEETMKERDEKAEKELERVKSHRDELAEWVEEELLPVAEQHDPRLANLRDAAKDMAAEVEKLRGLPFKKPFMRRLITRAQVGEWMRRDLKKDLPEDEVRKLVTVGAEFGLLAPGTDIYAVFSQFLEAGAAAFYKPDTLTFYHIEGNDGRGARPIVFHELVHALEDQHFGLDAFYRAVEEDSDMGLARRGLVEGSACHFSEKYEAANPEDRQAMLKSQNDPKLMQKQLQMLQSVPPVLIASIGLYPYKNAPAWLERIGADDAATIEALYKDPPVSTEQVLHPEKFPLQGARDYPHVVAAPDVASVLGDAWEKVEDNNLGELQTGILLVQLQNRGSYLPTFMSLLDMKTQGVGVKGAAKTASEGWDGDRYTAWIEKGGSAVTVVWTSVWDSEDDAKQFYETYGDLLGKRVLGKGFTARPSPARYAHEETQRVSGLDLAGRRVVAVLSAPADKADALFAAGAAAAVTPDPRDANDAK